MRGLKRVIAVAALAASCGPPNLTTTVIGPTGGEVCSTDGKICITIPPAALEVSIPIRIAATNEVPAGALGDGYEIGPSGTKFLKPAKVVFKIDSLFEEDSGVDPLLLRLYTRYEGEWQPLATPVPTLDRVRRSLSGTVDHLSPFVVLRADRLPDGGMPIELDGGSKDSGVIVVPPFDAGRPDAGRPDAGKPDAGAPDAGPPPPDAGPPDAGAPDAGKPDAGPPDAGPPDAGPPDAGPPDAGPPDAGPPDAGPPDSGPPDAGPPDAGFDAGFDAGADAGVDGGMDAGDGG